MNKKTPLPTMKPLKNHFAYFDGDELAATTWLNKYAMKNKQGAYVESTPDDMHWRMAREFARMEEKYRLNLSLNGSAQLRSAYGQEREDLTEHKIYELFKNFNYVIPQGSVMSALGNKYMIASLSNCVVLPEIYDSYGGVMYTDQQLTQLFKRRCGVGIDLSSLRPSGQHVSNAAGTTSGAVSFMDRFSNTTREVAQNGRRGALMITMDIAHPDVVAEFITKKQDLTKVTGANVSVRLSDEFMQAVADDNTYTHRWPIDSHRARSIKRN
jgi:ribonucleoside-diphosphate reductase alpha chain